MVHSFQFEKLFKNIEVMIPPPQLKRRLGGGNSNIFGIFTPIFGDDEPNLTIAYFSNGLVQNHQLEKDEKYWNLRPPRWYGKSGFLNLPGGTYDPATGFKD